MRSSKPLRSVLVALVGFSAVALSPARARASQEFPGALYEAANMPCVPDCVLCHGVSPGTEETWPTKRLGLFLGTNGAKRHEPDTLKAAFKLYQSNPANSASIAALGLGLDPQTNKDICTPSYGCGATIAHHHASRSPDTAGVVAGGLALLAGLLVMRRRRQRS
jgi:hypothetical protein